MSVRGWKVEPGETPADAAVREAFEEAGLIVSAPAEIGWRVHPRTSRTVVYAECETVTPTAAAARARMNCSTSGGSTSTSWTV